MALHVLLVALSLLPLLEAQNPEHANVTIGTPITNETLSWLSDKWFFMGAAFRNLEYKQSVQKLQTEFFYLIPNLINDTMEVPEFLTTEDRCVYNSTHMGFQRENGTFSKNAGGVEIFAHLIVLKKHGAFMLAFDPKDEKKKGLSFYAKKPDLAPELREIFQKAVKDMGMDESEIIFVDWKKSLSDKCSQQQKQLELEKETKKDP
ncbi:Alpha-1-acid glycoprotein 1 [Apodemus speciosus]|uniref:Alpha-1-acid glycoprotein n=1 Tax=Apodemus speciosus TaxID=105296 RepID=A0ABQ0ENG4_APOSI